MITYNNALHFQKTKNKEKDFKFDLFQETSYNKNDSEKTVGKCKYCYNFLTSNGVLKSGYGFKTLSMPVSTDDIDNEEPLSVRGSNVRSLWKLKWYDTVSDKNKYYLFYFNDEGLICFDSLFEPRPLTSIIQNNYDKVPYVSYIRYNMEDALLLSGKGDNLMIITGDEVKKNPKAPQIVSCCSCYGIIFAITASARGTLVYNDDLNILNFIDEKTKDLDFSDERGDLNKIVCIDDYIYLFRDFGITKISIYGVDKNFAVSHLYLSNSYIYPETVVQCGDEVLFLNESGLKSFNGTTVKNLDCECDKFLKSQNNSKANAVYFDNKYFLACRCLFPDKEQIGCEKNPSEYINNAMIIYDLKTNEFDIVRGVDIKQLLPIINPYKSKLIACFNGKNQASIGELKDDGRLFGESNHKAWISNKTDFNFHGKTKRIKKFSIKSSNDCQVTIESDKQKKTFFVKKNNNIQFIKTNLVGNEFFIKIESDNEIQISDFVVSVSVKE